MVLVATLAERWDGHEASSSLAELVVDWPAVDIDLEKGNDHAVGNSVVDMHSLEEPTGQEVVGVVEVLERQVEQNDCGKIGRRRSSLRSELVVPVPSSSASLAGPGHSGNRQTPRFQVISAAADARGGGGVDDAQVRAQRVSLWIDVGWALIGEPRPVVIDAKVLPLRQNPKAERRQVRRSPTLPTLRAIPDTPGCQWLIGGRYELPSRKSRLLPKKKSGRSGRSCSDQNGSQLRYESRGTVSEYATVICKEQFQFNALTTNCFTLFLRID